MVRPPVMCALVMAGSWLCILGRLRQRSALRPARPPRTRLDPIDSTLSLRNFGRSTPVSSRIASMADVSVLRDMSSYARGGLQIRTMEHPVDAQWPLVPLSCTDVWPVACSVASCSSRSYCVSLHNVPSCDGIPMTRSTLCSAQLRIIHQHRGLSAACHSLDGMRHHMRL